MSETVKLIADTFNLPISVVLDMQECYEEEYNCFITTFDKGGEKD